ncbi:restriction endonuclease subunit S [Paenibacillus glucanolyticus]|uniref:restriction endonuclease subunit S n=1 Tax=Paenibacillus glucanolyticus TaxID=59843 RepID=UPI0035E12414
MAIRDINEEYKITELGEIPIEWEISNIESIVEKIVGGGTPSRENSDFYSGSIPWITVKDMDGKIYKYSAQEFITEEAIRKSATNLINKDSVIVATRIALGRAFINKVPVAINQDLKALYLKKNVESLYFLYWYLSNNSLIEAMGSGSTVKGIRLEQLKHLLLPLPPLKEQQKIAEILSTVDEQIENTEQLIQKTKELKKGLMQQLLTKGIGHTEFKQTELGEIPVEWEASKLGESCEIIMGQSPKGDSYNTNGQGVPLLNGPTEFGEKHPTAIQWTTSPTKLCENGDILFCVRGSSIGRMNISDGIYCIGRGLAAIRQSSSTITSFIGYLIEYQIEKVLRNSAGSTFPNITKDELYEVPVFIPPLTEQQKIAGVLSTVDDQIEVYEEEKEKQLDLKKGLMQQLLTGKIRVTV